jgi:hypothetical protein
MFALISVFRIYCEYKLLWLFIYDKNSRLSFRTQTSRDLKCLIAVVLAGRSAFMISQSLLFSVFGLGMNPLQENNGIEQNSVIILLFKVVEDFICCV